MRGFNNRLKNKPTSSKDALQQLLVESGGLEMNKYKLLSEEGKIGISDRVLITLMKSIKPKLEKPVFKDITKSKGDITKYKAYDDLEKVLNKVRSVISNSSKPVDKDVKENMSSLDTVYDFVIREKDAFMRGFSNKDSLVMSLYVSCVSVIAEGSLVMFTDALEPTSDNFGNITINVKDRPKSMNKSLFIGLRQFSDMVNAKKLKDIIKGGQINLEEELGESFVGSLSVLGKFFNKVADSMDDAKEKAHDDADSPKGEDSAMIRFFKSNKFDKASDVTRKIGNRVILPIVALLLVCMFIRLVVFIIYRTRVNVADNLRSAAEVIDENSIRIQDKNVRERQEKSAKLFRKLADKVDVDFNVADSGADKDIRQQDELMAKGADDMISSYQNNANEFGI
ncbi:hypothetical protein FPHOBKDP_00225 [Listeria phage LPJP1]|nr:hypothetical protein FPHOBKDP_00225 [Listeria phage LPJP1]